MTLCLQMVLSLKLNVEIRETGTDGIGNSEDDVIGVAAKTRFYQQTGLSTFVGYVKMIDELKPQLGFLDLLTKTKELTIFAPSNAAFDFDPTWNPEGLQLGAIYNALLGHVVKKRIPSAAIADKPPFTRLTPVKGERFYVRKIGGNITVDGRDGRGSSNVIKADIFASNGVIHAIDIPLSDPYFDSANSTTGLENYCVYSKFQIKPC